MDVLFQVYEGGPDAPGSTYRVCAVKSGSWVTQVNRVRGKTGVRSRRVKVWNWVQKNGGSQSWGGGIQFYEGGSGRV